MTAYKLYIRMRIREKSVEEQVQWILIYLWEELVDIQKKSLLEEIKVENLNLNQQETFWQN